MEATLQTQYRSRPRSRPRIMDQHRAPIIALIRIIPYIHPQSILPTALSNLSPRDNLKIFAYIKINDCLVVTFFFVSWYHLRKSTTSSESMIC